MIEFVTYAMSEQDINLAIDAGADHLILEDSKLSVRSYADDYTVPGFDKFVTLAKHARSLKADIRLSANIDKLIHSRHYNLLDAAVASINQAEIPCIRVQDPGVAVYLRDKFSGSFHLATETGNNNEAGAHYYADNEIVSFERQILSNDWTAAAIQQFKASTGCELEFQVHGPVLLQYTDRRLMAGFEVDKRDLNGSADELPHMRQRIADVEGRAYPLYDNPHGHFMYASFDKSLYKHIDELKKCGLRAWLFDGRGESVEYLAEALRAYRQALTDGPSDDTYAQLQALARRNFKPGFFIANNTDYVFEADAQDHAETDTLAKVMDNVKGTSLVIQALEPIGLGYYAVLTPEGKNKRMHIHHMYDLAGNEIESCDPGQLAKINWTKGVYADCILTGKVEK